MLSLKSEEMNARECDVAGLMVVVRSLLVLLLEPSVREDP